MKAVRFAVLWWLALGGWWLILVGTNAGLEEIAGASAATLGTLLALGLRRQRLTRYRFEPAWIVKALRFPWNVLRELGIVLRPQLECVLVEASCSRNRVERKRAVARIAKGDASTLGQGRGPNGVRLIRFAGLANGRHVIDIYAENCHTM